MFRENSTCFGVRLPSPLSAICWAKIKIEFRGVRSSCDMLARNSDLYLDAKASSAAFSSTAWRACSISAFLRLLQQTFRTHGRFDGVEHDADAFRQLGKKSQVG